MDSIEQLAQRCAPACDAWSLRHVSESTEMLSVRQDVPEPPQRVRDAGVMVSVIVQGSLGNAATSDVSESGLRAAFAEALALAEASRGHSIVDYREIEWPRSGGTWHSPNEKPAGKLTLAQKFELLRQVCADANVSPEIVDRTASLMTIHTEQVLVTSSGARIGQGWDIMVPSILAVASANGDTIVRSSAGQYNGFCRQGGLEVLERAAFASDAPRVAHEAIELVRAPNCPSGEMDVLLIPDQMMLQIHESLGHPLELDRILGDERNFAGTSFVTLDMFGSFQYAARC
jgi:predicted Zn-dependent protease